MHQTGDVSALQLLAADLGFSLLPMCAEPDKGVEGEQLDDVERLADLQRAIRRNAPQKVRAKLLGALKRRRLCSMKGGRENADPDLPTVRSDV